MILHEILIFQHHFFRDQKQGDLHVVMVYQLIGRWMNEPTI